MTGTDHFNDWIKRRFPDKENATNAEVGAVLGLDESLVGKLRNGTRSVGLRFAHKLLDECGIPTASWLSDDADESVMSMASGGRKRR